MLLPGPVGHCFPIDQAFAERTIYSPRRSRELIQGHHPKDFQVNPALV
jgi:hypothetical protein